MRTELITLSLVKMESSNSNPKIKIFLSCHKECFIPEHPLLFPVQVGTALAERRFGGMLHDDEGENISAKNRTYCELTAQYWAWKNDGSADYYGFWHYRRYMSFLDENLPHNPFEDVLMDWLDGSVLEKLGLDEKAMREKIGQYDVIATTPVDLKKLDKKLKSNRHQWELTPYQYKEDLDVMLDIIREKYPEFYEIAVWYLDKSPVGYYCNMFIMRREIFREYSEWLFTILFEHEKRRDYTDYDATGYRVSGYLGERLFAIYYLWLKKSGKYRCCELQRTLFRNTDRIEETKPAFSENNIAVALASNDYFAPYMAVTLKSLIERSNSASNYDILVLTSDISEENRKILRGFIEGKPNFSLRFVNPMRLLSDFKPYLHGHYGHIETYYRLILHELFPAYDKILYLDSDMVVLADVAELFAEGVDGFLLAACLDADTAGLYNGTDPERKKYSDEVLKLKNPYRYFQAGTILFNLAEFRKSFKTEEILDFAASEKWLLQDQDVLNRLCEGRVKYVGMEWNVMADYEKKRIRENIALAPQWLGRMYMEARKNPKIVHYAGPEKPWLSPEMDFAGEFWRVARGTEFYEAMLFRMSHSVSVCEIKRFGISKKARGRNNPIRLVRGFFRRTRERGFVDAVRFIPKRVFGRIA